MEGYNLSELGVNSFDSTGLESTEELTFSILLLHTALNNIPLLQLEFVSLNSVSRPQWTCLDF